MLDIKFIRENTELIKMAAEKKKIKFNVEELVELDKKRLELLQKIEDLRAKQNAVSLEVPNLSGDDKVKKIEEMSLVKGELKKLEEEMEMVASEWRTLMLRVPNVPDISVPDGNTDEENLEVKKWGNPKTENEFGFKPKDHIEIMQAQDWVDFERGIKTSGFRGYFLKGDAVLLDFALWQYGMQKWAVEGFEPMLVPSLVKKETLLGSGYLPQGQDDLYNDIDGDYFAGTAEVATMYYHADEIIEKKDLPKKFISFSPCFRKEAGAHGKDVKGLYRVHEFMKLEQVVLCEANHEESVKHHEKLTELAEEVLEELGVPYHRVINCGGDLGLGQVKKYDLEAWMPNKEKYGETGSSSYFHDFQTRRLNIRYRDDDGKLKFVHSLNNTAIATPRLLLMIIENYQNADGTVTVPTALVPFMGGKKILGKPVF
ncbi:MAG: seryl-tRNA synthetase, seryl-tRNA synthetase [Candidatus Parcubacteria bacterium]|jgi:seryl-tRNA synthetase